MERKIRYWYCYWYGRLGETGSEGITVSNYDTLCHKTPFLGEAYLENCALWPVAELICGLG